MTLPKDQLAAMQQQVAAVAAYDTRYEGVAGEIIAERKQHIIESWVQDTSWSKRTRSRDYDATPDFVRLTAQFQSLAKLGQFTRAVEIGFAHRAVPKDQLHAAVQQEIDAICLGGPIAVAECKKLVRCVTQLPRDEAFRETAEWSARMFRSPEGAEGMAAFREKRKPSWVK